MKHTTNFREKMKKLSGYFIAFLVVALAFLAVGLGTLGSFYQPGEAFELKSRHTSEEQAPSVTFELSSLTETDKDGNVTTTRLRLVAVQLNIGAIYAEAGTPASLRIERSTSGTTFSSGLNAVIENFYTPEPETDETGKTNKVTTPDATDAFYRFVSPFAFAEPYWSPSYRYVRLLLNDGSPNVLINEIVFVGEKINSLSEGSGEYCVIPAKIHAATPYADESAEQARVRAEALLDAQVMPSDIQSSFSRYGKDEVYSLMTISEMRLGNVYAADANGNPSDTYTVDNVYGAFGMDILALGTLIFGMNPFGLRFFPMLASFGALVVLSRLIVRLTRREEAGLVFALLYALSALTLGYGHLGTPLMLGVFFIALAFDLAHRFYAHGMKEANFTSALPLLFAGLSAAAAICVNGAFLIPALGVCGLFVAGMLRQQQAKRYQFNKAVEASAEAADEPVQEEEGETPAPERRAGRVLAEYKFRNSAASVFFLAGIVLGAFLISLLGMLPAYYTYLKAYDNPASPTLNVFALAWRTFANGFVGTNAYGSGNAWNPFNILFRGNGSMYAVTAAVVNPVALLAAAAGIVFAIVRLVLLLVRRNYGKVWRAELRRIAILLGGLLLSVIAAVAVKECAAFVVLVYLFAFLLAANFFGAKFEGKAERAVLVVNIVGVVLLALAFALFAVFTFSIPLSATFLAGLGL